jgi:hypothetical protein
MCLCSNGTYVNVQTGWCNSTLALFAAIAAIVVTLVIVGLMPQEEF